MRRSGKTTRMIDAAIQELFTTGTVYVPSGAEAKTLRKEHGYRGYTNMEYMSMTKFIDMEDGDGVKVQDYFSDKFRKRLYSEHNRTYFVEKGSKYMTKEFADKNA